ETLEVLEAQLAEYEGTIIIVSHDRAFLDNIVTSTLVFESSGSLIRYAGGYSDWRRQGRLLAATDVPAAVAKRSQDTGPRQSGGSARRATKLSYKLQQELDGLPDRIESIEREISNLEAEAAAPEFYTQEYDAVSPMLEAIGQRRRELEKAVARWGELEDLHEKLLQG
ncbi:MAG: ABC transporter ATP-binding protein, partial [Pseudomonadota bacterium]|nr:ABC transporter ATP-binding protein [Pseudomonadota bacterium]